MTSVPGPNRLPSFPLNYFNMDHRFKKIKPGDLLSFGAHRPWPVSNQDWLWYQEWRDLIFLHGRVEREWLKGLVPGKLVVEEFNGSPWVSVVAFQMRNIRPRMLPPVGMLSDFSEVNVRTYVSYEGKPGVFFLSIDANKRVSCFVARVISGLPYRYSQFSYEEGNMRSDRLAFSAAIGEPLDTKTEFDEWITERYCLYGVQRQVSYRYDIHHLPWPLYKSTIDKTTVLFPHTITTCGSVRVEAMHYSPGLQVLAWPAVRL